MEFTKSFLPGRRKVDSDKWPLFDAAFYTATYPDIDNRDGHALIHYIQHGEQEGRRPHPLFDPIFYRKSNPDFAASGFGALEHYILFGDQEGRLPHPLFDPNFYRGTNPDIGSSGLGALHHYILYGDREGRRPHPLFDPDFYRATNPDVAESGLGSLQHYVVSGDSEGRQPNVFFAPNFYRNTNPDVSTSGMNTLQHYIDIGDRENRRPHPLFNPAFYREKNPDVAATADNMLEHYMLFGDEEGRHPHFLFDSNFYRETNQDIIGSGMGALEHYILFGDGEGRQPNSLFVPAFYRAFHPDVAAAGMNTLQHYVLYGDKEGHQPHPLFRPAFYRDHTPEADMMGVTTLEHYLCYGEREGRKPHPLFDPTFYRQVNSDLDDSRVGAIEHYILFGDREGRRPHPLFDPVFYRHVNIDVANEGVNTLLHFMASGDREGRSPNPFFDSRHFRAMYPSPSDDKTPFLRFLTEPECERHPNPLFDAAYQRATTPLQLYPDRNALTDYLSARSSLSEEPGGAPAKLIPAPRRSLLARDARSSADYHPASAPLISILMPAYNSDEQYLWRAVGSIRSQRYRNWELIIVDDGSTAPHMPAQLDNLTRVDERIRVVTMAENGGIAKATNRALESAQGDFIALLDHDDVVDSEALIEVVRILETQDAEVVYTDQCYANEDGSFHSAFHKPAWSPILLSGVMYIGHLLVVSRTLAIEAGGFDSRFDRVQDFEFMLRVGEKARRISHIPKILYDWRRAAGSIAQNADAKGKIEPLQEAAVNAHFARIGLMAQAYSIPGLPHRLRIIPAIRKSRPRIDVFVRGDRPEEAVKACVEYLERELAVIPTVLLKSADTLVLDDGAKAAPSTDGMSLAEALGRTDAPLFLVVDPLFMPNVENWIEYLLLYAERPHTAFVGPQLIDATGIVISAGLTANKKHGLMPTLAGFEHGTDGYAGSLCCDREVLALPAPYVLARRDILSQIGPPATEFNNFDCVLGELSFRATRAGLTNVVLASLPFCGPEKHQLFQTGGSDHWIFVERHADALREGDRYHNQNFQ